MLLNHLHGKLLISFPNVTTSKGNYKTLIFFSKSHLYTLIQNSRFFSSPFFYLAFPDTTFKVIRHSVGMIHHSPPPLLYWSNLALSFVYVVLYFQNLALYSTLNVNTDLVYDLRPNQEEENCTWQWTSSQPPMASEVRDHSGEPTAATLLNHNQNP